MLVYGDVSWYQSDDLALREECLKNVVRREILSGSHSLHFDAPEALASVIIETARSVKNPEEAR